VRVAAAATVPVGERNRQMFGAALAPSTRLRGTPGNITDHHIISAGVRIPNRSAGKKHVAMSTAAAQGIEGPLVVSRNKVMDMLGIKDSRGINRLVKEGKLNAARIGGRYWKINVASIVAYANGETMGA